MNTTTFQYGYSTYVRLYALEQSDDYTFEYFLSSMVHSMSLFVVCNSIVVLLYDNSIII